MVRCVVDRPCTSTCARVHAYVVELPRRPPPRYSGVWQCTRDLVRRDGFGALWRGYGACMLRAAPVNGTVFLIYSEVAGKLGRDVF